MMLGGVSRCAAVLLLVGCAEPVGPPAAQPEPVVTPVAAVVPAEPPAAITLAERIRQEGWLVRFWEQLTPAQRRRVAKQLRQGAAPAQEADRKSVV